MGDGPAEGMAEQADPVEPEVVRALMLLRLATLATTTNVTFNPGLFSSAAPGKPAWKPLLKPASGASLYEILMVNGGKTIASPSAPNSASKGFAVADGSTPPPPPAG